MAKYKVCFSGYSIVEANSVEEAEENYDDLFEFQDKKITETTEIDDFFITNNLEAVIINGDKNDKIPLR